MRVLDENKRKKIAEAAIRLIVDEGFAATSMHKIAKEAKVAASTIYLYFENKEDLLNKVYLMVKHHCSDTMRKNFDSQMPIKEGVRVMYDNIIKYIEQNKLNSSFLERFENSALIKENTREEAMLNCQAQFELIERGSKEGVLKKAPLMTIGSFIFYPIISKVRKANQYDQKLSKKEKDEVFQMVWDAIKA